MKYDIDWQEIVNCKKKELLQDIERLLKIPSVRGKQSEGAPVGLGPKQALIEMMQMGEEAGFIVHDFGPLVTRMDWGDESLESFGILGHVDVVPIGEHWDSDPFVPVYKDGNLVARGSLDDKGPLVCAFFAMKLLKERGFVPKRCVQLIVGSDEETDWECMSAYKQQAQLPEEGFVPDAYFPVVNGEKGVAHARFTLGVDRDSQADYCLMAFHAGLKENMVPATAIASVRGRHLNQIAQDFEKYLKLHSQVSGSVSVNEKLLELTLHGQSAHGSTPQNGVNAATYLADFLRKYPFGVGSDFLALLGGVVHKDSFGENLGIAHESPKMGRLTCNLGKADFDSEEGGYLILDIRFPASQEFSDIERQLRSYATTKIEVEVTYKKIPHYVSLESPLVQTLLRVYEEQTGKQGFERIIGGATYASLMPKGVAFGALFPDTKDTMHQANECIPIRDLLKATAIYAQAIAEYVC